ncbi:MAG: hypothetical protein WBQ94_11665 [Terracidiphilus sp.]
MISLRREMTSIVAVAALLSTAGMAIAQTPAAQSGALVMVAKIDGKLSTRNAKVGDAFSAKILKSWKLTDGTEIPKGSKITGKLALVKSKKDGDGTSMLSFRLDTIDVKGGAPVPVHGVVVAIGPSLAPKDGLGPTSAVDRNSSGENNGMRASPGRGGGSSSGLDPNSSLGAAASRDEDDIPLGSTQPGVSLGGNMDADWTTILQGIHRDIDLDSEVLIKVQLK